MKILKWQWWCLLACVGCQSDTEQLRDVEHRFLQLIEKPGQFPLSAGEDTLYLPVLPAPETAAQVQASALELQETLRAIDPAQLAAPDRQRLELLRQALDDMSIRGFFIPVDQLCSRLTEPFQQALAYKNTALTERFVAHLPLYFSEMEQRWQPLLPAKIPEALRQGETALELLQKLKEQAPDAEQASFETARWGLKDYLGLCQSGTLK